MENNHYEVFYQEGLKPEVSELQATEQLSQLFKVSAEQAQAMIQATNRVIKGELSREQAEKYVVALDKVGMRVEMRISAEQAMPIDLEDVTPLMVDAADQAATFSPAKKQQVNYDRAIPSNERLLPVEFNGKGFEYFKIWIVNILLTILTLGIYSAWAKVRNKQYFYGNTLIDGSSFHYTARPLTILKGRLIALGLFLVYLLINQFMPILGLVLFLLLLGFLPWIIIRSLAFNARNSLYRNIRFNFEASTGEALKAYLLWPILLLPTLGLILPFVWYKQSLFLVNNSAYGTTPFEFKASAGDYYKIFFVFLAVLLVLGLILAGLFALVGVNPQNPELMMALVGPLTLAFYLFMFAFLAAALGNLYFNSSVLAEHGFVNRLHARNLAWIYLTNTFAIALSLGLLIPWAQVRMMRYRASCLQLKAQGSLDDFISAEQDKVSALGEQVGEVFDMEVSVI